MKDDGPGASVLEGSAVVFPEGTRSRDGRLLPYKAAAVRIIAQESGLPLLPVVIDGTHVAADLAGSRSACRAERGTLTIGTPIPPEMWNGRIEDVVEEIRTWAAETIARGGATAACRLQRTGGQRAGFRDGSGDALAKCIMSNAQCRGILHLAFWISGSARIPAAR